MYINDQPTESNWLIIAFVCLPACLPSLYLSVYLSEQTAVCLSVQVTSDASVNFLYLQILFFYICVVCLFVCLLGMKLNETKLWPGSGGGGRGGTSLDWQSGSC